MSKKKTETRSKIPTLLRLPVWLNAWLIEQTGEGKPESRQDVIYKILMDSYNNQKERR